MADDAGHPIVHGHCDARFSGVRDAFVQNFTSGRDVGASVALSLDGELVVDLWGGSLDLERTKPWQEDTLVTVFSTTKTITALSALLLADRGELDLDAPVARYWPQFAAAGKEGVLVRHTLGHTSGLPGWDAPMTAQDLYDWDKCVSLLAAQPPWWAPGTASAYHAVTQGYLVGEVIRRITGQTVGAFFAQEIAGPLGVDFHIGIEPDHESRIAPIIAAKEPPPPQGDESSIWGRIAFNPRTPGEITFDPGWARAEIPAGNGQGNARAVAKAQALLACGGEVGGEFLMSREGCEAVLRQQSDGVDLAFQSPVRWAMGFALSLGDLTFGPRTCFWGGSGGSLIIVDQGRRMSLAYVMNQMVGAPFGDPRNASLAAAAYAALAQS